MKNGRSRWHYSRAECDGKQTRYSEWGELGYPNEGRAFESFTFLVLTGQAARRSEVRVGEPPNPVEESLTFPVPRWSRAVRSASALTSTAAGGVGDVV